VSVDVKAEKEAFLDRAATLLGPVSAGALTVGGGREFVAAMNRFLSEGDDRVSLESASAVFFQNALVSRLILEIGSAFGGRIVVEAWEPRVLVPDLVIRAAQARGEDVSALLELKAAAMDGRLLFTEIAERFFEARRAREARVHQGGAR